MIVEFMFEIGQEVKVKPIGMIGVVDSMSSNTGSCTGTTGTGIRFGCMDGSWQGLDNRPPM